MHAGIDQKYRYDRYFLGLEDYAEAVNAFESSLDLEEGNDKIPDAEKLRFRGIAKQKAGQNGFKKDIKEAANMGDKEAEELLKSFA